MFFSKKWNPDGLHVYVTGGSTGLGLSVSKILVQNGANVSIVARRQSKLDQALTELEKLRQNPNQKLNAYPFSLTDAKESAAALHAVCEPYGGLAPDAILACAGSAKPQFFVDLTEEDLTNGMLNGYWIQAWTVFAAVKLMVKQQRKGKIVLCSSTMGLMAFIGYSPYAPAKQALKGLGDTLHSELMLYGIDIQTYFPPTMYTEGYDEEEKVKPQITKLIEEDDQALTPDQAAATMYKGMVNGDAHITGELIGKLFRASTRGAMPRSNWIMDGIYDFVAFIATPVWRASVDRKVLAHRKDHYEYLTSKGFFTA
ncbi:oxidoreductase [Mycena floridula]|nr:oxidoreductase [Mycena floridula]